MPVTSDKNYLFEKVIARRGFALVSNLSLQRVHEHEYVAANGKKFKSLIPGYESDPCFWNNMAARGYTVRDCKTFPDHKIISK